MFYNIILRPQKYIILCSSINELNGVLLLIPINLTGDIDLNGTSLKFYIL